jgi:hypothetical protein
VRAGGGRGSGGDEAARSVITTWIVFALSVAAAALLTT